MKIAKYGLAFLCFTVLTSASDSFREANAASDESELIPSTSPAALPPPVEWSCDRILPEYQGWLEDGNNPNDWKYAKDVYYVFETGEQYTWADWIDHINELKCTAIPVVKPELLPVAGLLGPAIITGSSVVAAVASAATNSNKSPG